MFSSRFMLFPTLKKKLCKKNHSGGGGGGDIFKSAPSLSVCESERSNFALKSFLVILSDTVHYYCPILHHIASLG